MWIFHFRAVIETSNTHIDAQLVVSGYVTALSAIINGTNINSTRLSHE